jgi:hypothetical protein
MAQVIHVLDIARSASHDLGPEEPILRGPYELFRPLGAIRRQGDLIAWREGDLERTARVVQAKLGDAHPGERVLLRLPPRTAEDEWWLCEVQMVDGIAAA